MNESSNKFNKILIVVFSNLAILLFVVAIVIVLYNNETKKIITNLGIDDYFKYILTTEQEKNVNLLDISNDEQMKMYYYYNKNTKNYRINFKDPTYEDVLYLTYGKYDEYIDYYKKVFGTEIKIELTSYDIHIEKLKNIERDLYENLTSPVNCIKAETVENCYIKLTKDTNINGDVEITDLKRNDNIITGIATFNNNNCDFTFKYEKKNKNCIIKSLEIK